MKTIIGKVENIDGNKVILLTQDNQRIIWPKDKLVKDIKPGHIINFNVLSQEELASSQKDLAKEILEEIFSPETGEK